MNKNTFYEVLQVSPNADPEIIKAAYKSLVQRHHPDKNAGNPEAERFLKILNRAYEVLSDPVKRAGYDAAIAEMDEDQPERPGAEASTKEPAAKKNNSSGANGGRPQTASGSETNTLVPRPWIRYWARTIDYVVCGVIVGVAFGILDRVGAIPTPVSLGSLSNPFVLSMLTMFTWAFVEPVVIAAFGTTIGKAILKVKLAHQSNERLSKVDLGVLYQRSIAVWLKGMGIGFPLVVPITQFVSYRHLKSHGITSWDRDGGFTVTHGKVGYARGSLATMIIVLAIVLNAVGNDYQKHHIRSASITNPQTSLGINESVEPTINPAVVPSYSPVFTINESVEPSIGPAPAGHSPEAANVNGPYAKMQALYNNHQFSQVVELAETHLVNQPNDPFALNYAGLALVAIGNRETARVLYKRAIKLRPKDSVLYYNLVSTYDPYTEYQTIINILKTAQKNDPNNKLINDSLKAIQPYADAQRDQDDGRPTHLAQKVKPLLSRRDTPSVGTGAGQSDSEITATYVKSNTAKYQDFVSTTAFGTLDEVKEAIRNGADINASNDQRNTALVAAARNNRPEIVRLLLSAGADVEGVDKDGRTAMFHAKVNANREIIEMLQSYGASNPFAK